MALSRFAGLLALLCVIVIAVSLSTAPALIAQSPNPTDEQATLNAAVQTLIAATAQAHTPTPDYTATVASMLEMALTATATASPPTPFPAFDPAAIQITETVEYDLFAGPARSGAFLSPDGERFLYAGMGDELCVYETFGGLIDCTPLDDIRYDPSSFAWSPDGRYIVFVDNTPIVTLQDSDIWLFDTEQGTVTNLTDDGVQIGVLRAIVNGNNLEDAAPADIQARFSPDSAFVYFVRYEAQDQTIASSLYRIPVSGGEAERVSVLTEDAREQGYVTLMDISPDGQMFVFDVSTRDQTTLNLYSLAGNETRELYALDMEAERMAETLEFSPAGDAVLWHDALLGYSESRDLIHAHITTLEGDTFSASSDPGTIIAGWSPDGSAITYIVQDARERERTGLYVGRPGEVGHLIASPTEDSPLIFAPILPPRLEWRPNGALLYTQAGGSPLYAVRLGEK